MQNILTSFLDFIKNILAKSRARYDWFMLLPKKEKAYFFFGGLVLIFIFVIFLKDDTEVISPKKETRQVTTASVSSLSNQDESLPLIGNVTSVSEAMIRTEGGGRLTKVYKKKGDTVFAGGVIAELENSAERAALLQAEGAYEQAKAAKDITNLQSGQAGSSLSDAKNQALTMLSSAYITMDDAIRGKTDTAYRDPKQLQVKLILALPDASLTSSLEMKRISLEKMLVAREQKNKTLTTSSDLLSELTVVQNEIEVVKAYLDDMFTAYNKALPDTSFSQTLLDAGKISTQSARQSINSTLSSLVSSRGSLNQSITANEVAGNQTVKGGGTLATADAQVKQALGAYNAALSRLEKTIIRSPITGTINSLSIETGDYINAYSQVAVVSNNGALEVLANVTEDDAKRVTIGAAVLINNSVKGIVTRVAQAIDPVTKKMEVRVGITDEKTTLINGQSVTISVEKNKKNIISSSSPIVIPIASLKLTPKGAMVFTVSSSSHLIAIPVKEGAILGETIQIIEGLTGEEVIVTDARGLKDGLFVDVITTK